MPESQPVTMLVSYFPKPGKEDELLQLIRNHWPTLDRVGLVSSMPARVWRATDKRTNRVYFVEMFQWRDELASDAAHANADVRAIWAPMQQVLEDMTLARIEPIVPEAVRRTNGI